MEMKNIKTRMNNTKKKTISDLKKAVSKTNSIVYLKDIIELRETLEREGLTDADEYKNTTALIESLYCSGLKSLTGEHIEQIWLEHLDEYAYDYTMDLIGDWEVSDLVFDYMDHERIRREIKIGDFWTVYDGEEFVICGL